MCEIKNRFRLGHRRLGLQLCGPSQIAVSERALLTGFDFIELLAGDDLLVEKNLIASQGRLRQLKI